MKQKLLSAILAILFPLSAFCTGGDEFTTEVCGTEMTFVVLNETDKTCGVGKAFIDADNTCIDRSYAGDIIIPSEVNGYTVIEIGYNAFNSCLGVTSVSIPNTVKTIRPYAFANCSGMTSISIPSSVKNIEEGAFACCTSLTSVNITDIEAWCNIQFSDWDGGVQRISNPLFCAQHLFLNGEEVHELSIPNTVTSISAHAFESCASITSVDIPSSVTSIGEKAFALTHLTSVTIPSQITSYKGAFAGCTLLTSVEISDGITLIDEGAFNGCTHLTSIEIPNSVTTIGRIAFGRSGLTSITLPTSVTTIEFGAFAQCNGLTSITLPANVTSIGEAAFYQCSALTSVISQIQEPFAFGNSAFADISDACVLYVPKGTKDAYIAAGWTEEVFKGGIVEMDEGDDVWSAEFPDGVPEDEEEYSDIYESAWGTGTFTYSLFYTGSQSQSVLRRYSLLDPNRVQFCLFDWFYGVNLIIDADYSQQDPVTGYVPLTVVPQYTGYTHSIYGQVMVSDSYTYRHDYRGEENVTPEDYPSYYDELDGRFVLNLAYYVSAGCFGLGEEYFQLDGYAPFVEALDGETALKKEDGTFTQRIGIVAKSDLTPLMKYSRYALLKGNLSAEEVENTVEDMLNERADEFLEYGVINNEEVKQVNLTMTEEGEYTFIVLPFNKRGEAKQAQTLHFVCPKQNWVDCYVGTYIYRYAFARTNQESGTWSPTKQDGLILQQDTENPTQWRIKNCWGNDTYFMFTHNDDGSITIDKKQVISNLGVIRDDDYVFVISSEYDSNVSSYDIESKTYSFDLVYLIRSVGGNNPFGIEGYNYYYRWPDNRGCETFVITDLVPLEEDETVDIAEEITEDTNIDGNVIGNIFYNINPENGGYADGCIVVSKPTEESSVEMDEGTDIFGEDFKAGFTGIVFKVPAGSGTIKITAETTGSMVMKVKIGNNDPIEMELDGKLKVSFPYNVPKDTYVYIYGSTASSDVKGMHKAPGDGELKIYGVELKHESTPTDIEEVQGTKDNVQSSDGNVYDLTGRLVRRSTFDGQRIPKGLYIKDGKKILVK